MAWNICKVKNISGQVLQLIKELSIGEEYTIPDTMRSEWTTYNSAVLAAICADQIQIGSSEQYFDDYDTQIDWLEDHDNTPCDTDGSPLSRVKITKTGWGLQCHAIEFTTSKLDSVNDIDADGEDWGFSTIKFFDENDTELTTQEDITSSCVCTELYFEPTNDYEVIGGEMWQKEVPTAPIRCNLRHALTGHEFCTGGFNAEFLPAHGCKKMDGRAPKLLPYNATYHTGMLVMTTRHPAGVQHDFQLVIEIFTP